MNRVDPPKGVGHGQLAEMETSAAASMTPERISQTRLAPIYRLWCFMREDRGVPAAMPARRALRSACRPKTVT